MRNSLVVMGVAGCGKSSVAERVAAAQAATLVEGDAHHSAAAVDKMRRGIALTEADRAPWLDRLGSVLREAPSPIVLSCSALRLAYRERLRAAAPGLRFVYLEIDRAEAMRRVGSRGAHFFSAELVDSQFATLEPPAGEPGVLRVDATEPLPLLESRVAAWLRETD